MTPKNRAPSHPGEVLNEAFMIPLGLTVEDVSSKTGLPTFILTMLINEQTDLSSDMAESFAKMFGTSAQFWINLQNFFNDYVLQTFEESSAEKAFKLCFNETYDKKENWPAQYEDIAARLYSYKEEKDFDYSETGGYHCDFTYIFLLRDGRFLYITGYYETTCSGCDSFERAPQFGSTAVEFRNTLAEIARECCTEEDRKRWSLK